MSSASLFVFVEGKTDRFLMSKIVYEECSTSKVDYLLFSAEEIEGNGGGKSVLLKFFDFLKARFSLIDNFSGSSKASLFILDKDVDDLTNRVRKNQHIVYTEHYDLENYIFLEGDIQVAAAVTAGLDVAYCSERLPDSRKWASDLAVAWKEWIAICLYSHTRLRRFGGAKYYSRPGSQIHSGKSRKLKKRKYSALIRELEDLSPLQSEAFSRSFARLERKVELYFSEGRQDAVFKGKWYARAFAEDVEELCKGKAANLKSLRDRLLTAMTQTVDVSRPWADKFRESVRVLLREVRSE